MSFLNKAQDGDFETVTILSHFSFKKLCSATLYSIAAISLFILADIQPAYAQDEDTAPIKGRQFSARAGQKVTKALEFLNAEQYPEALTALNESLRIKNLNPYEFSTIYQMQGSVFYELARYKDAIRAFQNSINSGGLLPNEADGLKINIAQLLVQDEQYVKGALAIEDYLDNGGQQKPQYIDLLVGAWVQAENYSRALPWAEVWFNIANPKERKHFDLLNFLYSTLEQPEKQLDIVKQMIVLWPEDTNLWNSWASLLGNGGQEQAAFEVNKMLYLGGALEKESDLLKVVQYYSYYDMPFQAANILEREINRNRINANAERLIQLSDLLRQSREYKRAIPVLKRAANVANTAKLYADLGEALYNEGLCLEAETAFKNAMERGYDSGKAWMLIGTCRYESAQKEPRPNCETTTKEQRSRSALGKKRRAAIVAFSNVPRRHREKLNARKWASFIQAEGQAVEARCQFILDLEQELCFLKIKQAYDAEIFTGGFKLDDQKCQGFKANYDEIFRPRTAG